MCNALYLTFGRHGTSRTGSLGSEVRGVSRRRCRHAEVRPLASTPLARGAALFDAGDFFGAHEVWEDGWRRSAGAERTLYQGLIQTAAAYHKIGQGSRRGALTIAERALRTLSRVDAWEQGVNVEVVREALRQVVTALSDPASPVVPPAPRLGAPQGPGGNGTGPPGSA